VFCVVCGRRDSVYPRRPVPEESNGKITKNLLFLLLQSFCLLQHLLFWFVFSRLFVICSGNFVLRIEIQNQIQMHNNNVYYYVGME